MCFFLRSLGLHSKRIPGTKAIKLSADELVAAAVTAAATTET